MAPKRKRSATAVFGLTSNLRLGKILRAIQGGHECSEWFIRQSVGVASDLCKELLHKEPMEMNDGNEFIFEVLEPNRLVSYVVKSCPELAEMYARAANLHEPTLENPWEMTCCFDEFVSWGKTLRYQFSKIDGIGIQLRTIRR